MQCNLLVVGISIAILSVTTLADKKSKAKLRLGKLKLLNGNRTRESRSEKIVIIPKEARFGLPKLYVTAGLATKTKLGGGGGGGGWGGGGAGGGGNNGGWGSSGNGGGGSQPQGWGGGNTGSQIWGGGSSGGGSVGQGWGGGGSSGGQGWGASGGNSGGQGWGKGGGNSGGWGNNGGGGGNSGGWGGGASGGGGESSGGGGWGGGGGSGGGGWGGSGGQMTGGSGGGWGGSSGGGWGQPQGWGAGGSGGGGWGWQPHCPDKKAQKAKKKAQKKKAKAKKKANKKGGWGGWDEDEDEDGRSGGGWYRTAGVQSSRKGDEDLVDEDEDVYSNAPFPPRNGRLDPEKENTSDQEDVEAFKYFLNTGTVYGDSLDEENLSTERLEVIKLIEENKSNPEKKSEKNQSGTKRQPTFPISSDIVPLPMEVEANPIFPETISLRLVCPKLLFAKTGKTPSMCMYVRA